ncbi:hypothetical protein ACERIT_06765 [Halopenitus sp. H-Gu1]|uniref:hypothetical protein n=1 Tax=Halopenitus sp. H-Gu1 TaxID=3242697 RepID=UPI00359D970E
MPGRASSSQTLQYVGAIAAAIGVIGYVVFGWRFGETDATIPFIVGALGAAIAIGWTLYHRMS